LVAPLLGPVSMPLPPPRPTKVNASLATGGTANLPE